jgi:hypothetical protein
MTEIMFTGWYNIVKPVFIKDKKTVIYCRIVSQKGNVLHSVDISVLQRSGY